MTKRCAVVLVGVMLSLQAPLLAADGADDYQSLREAMEAIKQEVRQQNRKIAELEAELEATKQASQQSVGRDEVRQIVQEVQAERGVIDLPSWLEGLKLYGDLRLRYEGQCFNWDDSYGKNKPRHRARFRVRAGLAKTWLDKQLDAGFRLASGSSDTPTSTNQTFGDGWDEKDVWIDLAYARYSPDAVKGFTIIGGKMKTPWLCNNGIFIDGDVNPEGVWAEYKAAQIGPASPFVGAGYFILEEDHNGTDATMGAFQAGARFDVADGVKYTLAGGYQDYHNYEAANDVSASGNSSPLTDVPDFRVASVSNKLEFDVSGAPVALFADWAHNCAEGDPDAAYHGEDNAYAAGVKVGKNKKKGDWSAGYKYAWVEANALPGYFVDSDFGFANRKGHVIGAAYNLLDSLTLGGKLLVTEPIFSPTSTASAADEDLTTTVQVDLLWKF